jgi:hypothetical protein
MNPVARLTAASRASIGHGMLASAKSRTLAVGLAALCLFLGQSLAGLAESAGILTCTTADHCEESKDSHEPADKETGHCCCVSHCGAAVADMRACLTPSMPTLIGTLSAVSDTAPPAPTRKIDHPPQLS